MSRGKKNVQFSTNKSPYDNVDAIDFDIGLAPLQSSSSVVLSIQLSSATIHPFIGSGASSVHV